MKNLIFVPVIIILMLIGCSESVMGPDESDNPFSTPIINSPKEDVYISCSDGDTIYADWNMVEGCTKIYRAIIYYDSIEVAKPDSISRFNLEIGISPKIGIGLSQQTIFLTDSSNAMLIIQKSDFENYGDTIKVFWKIMGQNDEEDYLFFVEDIEGLYSRWSNIESFYLVNMGI